MINRRISLPAKQSFFLLGPRQTGKSTLIQQCFLADIWSINLLLNDDFFKYSEDPSIFRKEAEKKITESKIKRILIDEIQRVPALLNEVQYLMSKYPFCQFILTGSSARKLKKGGANLLAGRAVERYLFPFLYEEIQDRFTLEDALRYGTLPAIFGKNDADKLDVLQTYAHVYIKEEIISEGIARNLGGFSRFLEMAAAECGELVSFSNIARECHLPVRTVQSYYEILEDTLIGFRLNPWSKSQRKRMSAHPKFYLFDSGVTNAVNKRLTSHFDSMIWGRLFEQWIILETYRLLHYSRSEANLFFWRTHHGAEVDLLIEKHGKLVGAFEIKHVEKVVGAHLSGLRAFREEHPKTPCYVVSLAKHAYDLNGIHVIPWRDYLSTPIF